MELEKKTIELISSLIEDLHLAIGLTFWVLIIFIIICIIYFFFNIIIKKEK